MKVRSLAFRSEHFLTHYSRNKHYTIVRPTFHFPPRVSPIARLVLFLWRFPPPLQCLHVRPFHPHPSPPHPPSRIIGIPSTGSAGLIQTIQMFSQGHLVAGILGTIATAGWTLQGVGNAFYYRQVCCASAATLPTTKQFPDLVSSHSCRTHHG